MASLLDGYLVCAVGIACVVLGGCSSEKGVDCTLEARASLSVTVQHEGVSVCDAVVTATLVSSDDVHALEQLDCSWTGPFEVRGTFEVSATTPDGRSGSVNVSVGGDECHVRTENVIVSVQ